MVQDWLLFIRGIFVEIAFREKILKLLSWEFLFLQNFLSSQNEQNARYVDLDKISLEDLFNLNQINEQLQSNLKLTSISFDGFTLHQSEPQNIEYRGNFQGDTEAIPFVFQYDKTLKRIFYFDACLCVQLVF